MKGKNIAAIHYSKPATFTSMSKYDRLAFNKISPHYNAIITGKKDINTALAEAAQDINNAVTVAKQSK